MSITIKEIAELCGVSHGTVDRALNDRPGISLKTKEKILKVAADLNYQPDFLARSLAKGTTKTIGLVLFDLYNRSFSQLTNSIEMESRQREYFVNLLLTDKSFETEKQAIEHLVNRKVDGIILFPINQGADFEQYLKRFNVPIVTICNKLSDYWSYIGIDDRSAMSDAVQYVIDKGYQRIVYICPPLAYHGVSNIYTQEKRLEGLLEGMRLKNFAEEPIIVTDKHYIRALDNIDLKLKRTAIICSCDQYALETMNYLKDKGIRIPDDIGLLGFDNIDVLKYITPKLTTVHYNVEQMGKLAVDVLLEQIDKSAVTSPPLIEYKIIEGESL
ncbi:LacI family DNA-binding transcriptional regulator [Paenibacillus piri]|uniref:LacI family transcriptional regulator n=1 Tax=Paenibacillus piri TaxID=2547395 RepID=A0A4R5KI76_9BACL|nr:LacI family DNA-binding transcriptional regulator [Paenibacillus piri]TDF95153.1 LacI family transcriptional regulator [Paenibacillus piri]